MNLKGFSINLKELDMNLREININSKVLARKKAVDNPSLVVALSPNDDDDIVIFFTSIFTTFLHFGVQPPV